MKDIDIFAQNVQRYDQWFERHYHVFLAELATIEKIMPKHHNGIEIGVGTGRFAAPLGIKFGIDPVPEMLEKAASRGIQVQEGVAENIPYPDASFDYVLMTTTVCFLNDIPKAFSEVARILQDKGNFTIAFIDKDSPVGKKYRRRKNHPFYSQAHFFSPEGIYQHLAGAGFEVKSTYQTLLPDTNCEFDCCEGYGRGSFVVITSQKG